MKKHALLMCLSLAAFLLPHSRAHAQAPSPPAAPAPPPTVAAPPAPVTLRIDLGHPGARVSPMLYGLMTEEINHAYDGGLYAELLQNRQFQDDLATPLHWSLVQDGGGSGSITLDTTQPLNAAQPVSLKLTVGAAGARVGVANDGFWGIPVRPATRYRATFFARADSGFSGPLTASIESADGATVYARGQVAKVSQDWKQYTVSLTTGRVAPTQAARFVLSAAAPGTVRFSLVSLFPPTYNDRPNGNRIDLMQKLAAMRPAFLRLPGGDYLEGETIATRFDWKKTVGPLEGRPGHLGPWSYRSSDGLGLLEYLEWCEDLKMEPLLAVYAGYSRFRHKNPNPEAVAPGPALQPYVQDALDEIEYTTGDTHTKWGAERARDGHPAPFPLHYVEIGNEDFFDKAGTYDGRFAQFFDAIRTAYPKLQLIATTKVGSRTPDLVDDHFYRQAVGFEKDVHHYDDARRTGPKVLVGEWATREGTPTPDMNAALGDAAWMTGMERNADVVVMASYAPLLVNVNPGARQWRPDLIGYDALTSYGSPSYYAQKMFRDALGDVIIPATLDAADTVFESVTRDSRTGALFVKMVNPAGTALPVHVTLTGARSVSPTGTATVLSGSGPTDTNTITDPVHILPVTFPLSGLGPDFDTRLPPYSITVFQMQTK